MYNSNKKNTADMDENRQVKVFPISFEVYAYDETEVEALRRAIVGFIDAHARQGRPVLAHKAAQAISEWEINPFVKSRIINYFKQQ